MSEGSSIQVILNGEPHSLSAGTSLLDFLEQMNEPHGAAVVERNHRFVHKSDLAKTIIKEGDVLEVILPSFGG